MSEHAGEFIILMEEQSYLGTSFEKAFEKKGTKATVMHVSKDSVEAIQEKAKALIICTSTELLHKVVSVKVIMDQAIKNNVSVFAMGNVEELDVLWKTLPKQMVMDIFVRPINMGEMVDSICKQIDEIEKREKKKILAVDDSGVVLRNIKSLLEDRYQVVLANSGALAIKYLALNTPDLILLDYEMPIVDGKQVMQMIREDSESAKIPIIFLTGKNDAQTVMQVMELKPEGYLLKTMEPGKLHAAIDDFFLKQSLEG